MNKLEKLFLEHTGRLIFRWAHYFQIYERHFEKYVNKIPRILELGVFHGGSLQLWKKYFGEGAVIVGVDLNPTAVEASDNPNDIHVYIGDQSDKAFLTEIAAKHGPFDIVIDDASHQYADQINSFKILWPHLKQGGVYVVEDTHTSYMKEFKKSKPTFARYAFERVQDIHVPWDDSLDPTPFTLELSSVCFYNSVVVFEKNVNRPLKQVLIGTPSYCAEDYVEYQAKFKPDPKDYECP